MRREPQANGPTGERFVGVVQSVGSVSVVELIELLLLGPEQFLEGCDATELLLLGTEQCFEGCDAMLEQPGFPVREWSARGLRAEFSWGVNGVGDLWFDGLGFASRRGGRRFSGGDTAALSRRSRRALTGVRPVRAVSKRGVSGGG